MEMIESLVQVTGSYGPFVAVALATFLIVETVLRSVMRRHQDVAAINQRLKALETLGDRQLTLAELRRKRGLSAQGDYVLPMVALNRVLVQSGLQIGIGLLVVLMAGLAGFAVLVSRLFFESWLASGALGLSVGIGAPLLFLSARRSRRMKQLEEQLPEAIDVMVRSLRAGHPIPVAISLVGREMPDPAGSEFGMVSDEMTYGLDLPTAMGNLRERTGQMDIALLVVAISIQAKSGGNLAELLTSIGRMIRERYRVRRKVHALSAEGRFSSVALSLIPVVVYVVVRAIAPAYYSDVQNDPAFMPAFYVGLVLWIIGIVTIRRMVNFKI